MSEVLTIVILALFPAFGNFAGGLLAEWFIATKKGLNLVLHAASGIILAVVCIAVMPTAIQSAPPWLIAWMFFVGGCSYLLVEIAIKKWQGSGTRSGAWMVYVAVAADLFGDGLLIGLGSAVSTQLGLILALGQILADIPEGYAVIANFRDKGMPKMTRLFVSASFAIPIVAAALGSYFLLRGQGDIVKMSGLVFVAGLFTLAAVEDILKQAHETVEDTRWSAISFLGGFSLFVFVFGLFGEGS